MNFIYDIIIIGAGVVGCAIARELSRYDVSIAVIEKECDVGMATSSKNSGVIHAGFNCSPGALKTGFCVEGCKRFEGFCKELDVPYKRTGKLVIAFDEKDLLGLKKLKDIGDINGVEGLQIIDKEEIHRLEPNVGGIAALYSPMTAVTSPYQLTIALAENAALNGVSFYLNNEVKSIKKKGIICKIYTDKQEYSTKYIINCAGLFSDKIARMIGMKGMRLYPCRGEYFILDKKLNKSLNMPVYPVPRPEEGGLGVHLTTTIDGNILVGPSAEYIKCRNDYSTTETVMNKLFNEAKELLPIIEKKDFIRQYSGIRPKLLGSRTGGFGDFYIKESDTFENMVNLIGIESPGLTSAPLIAEYVTSLILEKVKLKLKDRFNPIRKAPIQFSQLSEKEKQDLILKDPEYGEIVCRCEGVTLKEIRQAINNSLGVKSIAAIKYRTRAMMGRCQGGYCLTRVISSLINESGVSPQEINYKSNGSYMFSGRVK